MVYVILILELLALKNELKKKQISQWLFRRADLTLVAVKALVVVEVLGLIMLCSLPLLLSIHDFTSMLCGLPMLLTIVTTSDSTTLQSKNHY